MADFRAKYKTSFMRILSLALALALAASMALASAASVFAVSEEEIEETKKKSEEAQAEADAAGEKAEEFMQKVEEAEAEIDAIQVRIDEVQVRIDAAQARVDEAQARIEKTEKRLRKKEKEVEEQTQALNDRLSAMYKTGSVGFIDVLLSSNNVTELITNMSMVHMILANDKELLQKLREDYAEIQRLKKQQEEEKAELEKEQAVLESEQAALESEQAALESKRAEYADLADEYNRKMEEMAAEADRLAAEAQAKQEEYEAEIRRQREEAARKAAEEAAAKEGREVTEDDIKDAMLHVSSSGYIWPVSSTLITQYFGYNKWAATHYSTGRHSGTDIGGMKVGTPIYAPCDGIITSVAYARYGLGYYVALADGEHFVFFFGHMCQWPSVKEGQYVQQGDLLGYVGSTGYSTGPHLHYELRIDGVRSDVLQLYPGMF
ncbi:MAG: peptidoglycan DD-metalloendopeptidase family protein [Mogibacterium sp.]|nr:peptidoglycan DD-metalloendopeptidase family protein [Mogibacterium sp.]